MTAAVTAAADLARLGLHPLTPTPMTAEQRADLVERARAEAPRAYESIQRSAVARRRAELCPRCDRRGHFERACPGVAARMTCCVCTRPDDAMLLSRSHVADAVQPICPACADEVGVSRMWTVVEMPSPPPAEVLELWGTS